MDDKKIFPPEILEYTTDYHFQQHSTRSQRIYQLVLLIIIIGLVSMFIVTVDVSVRSTGIIRSEDNRNQIKALVGGRVDSIFVAENDRVQQGQVLLTIQADILTQQNALVEDQQAELEAQVLDLKQLIQRSRSHNWGRRPSLSSGLYNQEFTLFWQRISDARTTLETVRRDYERNETLIKVKAISEAEFDRARLMYQNAQNNVKLIGEEQEARWQAELTQLQMKVRELSSRSKQYAREKEFYTIKAPIGGTVQQLKGLQPGTSVSASELLAEISPDAGMVAEMYVLPKDIGLIHPGTPTRLQVDAYNYNQWGLVTGKVISISNDVYTKGSQPPYFKVRCQLDKDELRLSSGYVGKLKKGMTLQARFLVTKRTVFQLLYDKADDWLNPNLVTTEETPAEN